MQWQYSTVYCTEYINSQIEIHIFLFKDQLSAVEEESISVAEPEVENFKQTIANKDREVALVTGELQALHAQLNGMGNSQLEKQQEVDPWRSNRRRRRKRQYTGGW